MIKSMVNLKMVCITKSGEASVLKAHPIEQHQLWLWLCYVYT